MASVVVAGCGRQNKTKPFQSTLVPWHFQVKTCRKRRRKNLWLAARPAQLSQVNDWVKANRSYLGEVGAVSPCFLASLTDSYSIILYFLIFVYRLVMRKILSWHVMTCMTALDMLCVLFPSVCCTFWHVCGILRAQGIPRPCRLNWYGWHWQILKEGAKHLDMFGPAVWPPGPPTPLSYGSYLYGVPLRVDSLLEQVMCNDIAVSHSQ